MTTDKDQVAQLIPKALELPPRLPLNNREVQIWVGPQHPGITGNMAMQVWVEGDEVKRGITHVGYLHRGFEKLIEQRKYIQAFPIVCRICVPEPDTNEYLLAAGFEELAGVKIPEKAKWIRTMVLEMSRLVTLLQVVGGQGGVMSLGTLAQWMIVYRDWVLDSFEELTGARVYHMYVLAGGVRRDLPEGFAARLRKTLDNIESRLPMVDSVLFDNAVFQTRAKGVGIVPVEWADEMGISGPVVRAMGLARDTRKDYPYLAYPELDFDVVTEPNSDIYSRARVRRREISQSIDLLRQILDKMPSDGPYFADMPNALTWKIPKGQTYVRAEATRGEFGYFMVTDGSDKARRVHVRGPSYIHGVSMLERMLPGLNFSDLAATMVSLQTCPPEIER